MQEVFLTAQGYKELEERLEYLKTVRRHEVSEKIKIAREFGDISENAEYDSAKDEQAMVEGEILEIENKLHVAKSSTRTRRRVRLCVSEARSLFST